MKIKKSSLRKLSLFGTICTVVAIGYIGYRFVAVLGPNGLGSFLHKNTATIAAAAKLDCGAGEAEATIHNTPRSVPQSYQQFLAGQPVLGKNLIVNATMTALDKATAGPQKFFRTAEDPALTYKLSYDEAHKPYLHLEQKTSQDLGAGWVAQAVSLKKDAAYIYSFSYRSSVPTVVTAEFISATGAHSYKTIAQLDKSDSWRVFTDYFNNMDGSAAGFRFIISPLSPGSIDTRDYDIHEIGSAGLPEGLVSVTFDDGWQSIADKALPLLKQQNIRTTQYIITDAAERKVAGYMDYATIAALKARGDEIGSHSLSHCNQAELSDKDIKKNAEQSKKTLQTHKLGAIDSFAYPYGSYSEKSQSILAGSYPFIRTSDEGYNDRYFNSQNIRSFAITSHTSDQQLQAWLDYAKIHKVWLVLVYHRVDEGGEYSITAATLKRQLQIIHDGHLATPPLSEAAHSITKLSPGTR